jgi:hypothetical protein
MCSVETNDTVQVQVHVQESGPSKENHPTLGESLRPGETNRTADESRLSVQGSAEESRPATSCAAQLTTRGSTVHCSTLSTTLGNGPNLASLATPAGPGSSAHSSDPPRLSTNHSMVPTASAMRQSCPPLHPPH